MTESFVRKATAAFKALCLPRPSFGSVVGRTDMLFTTRTVSLSVHFNT